MSASQLSVIDELHTAFGARNVEYWLFGGWAVDFHAGRVTRPHADIDIAVWLHDLERVREVFDVAGWRRVSDRPEEGSITVELDGVRVDIAFLALDADGSVYTRAGEARGEWPTGSFNTVVAILDRVEARVVDRDALIADKLEPHGGDADAKDLADVAVLRSLG